MQTKVCGKQRTRRNVTWHLPESCRDTVARWLSRAGWTPSPLGLPSPVLNVPRARWVSLRGPSTPAEVWMVTEGGTSRFAFLYCPLDPDPSRRGQLNLAGQTKKCEKSHCPLGTNPGANARVFTWLR